MNLIINCPICNSNNLFDFVNRKEIPVHQNLVYTTLKSAKNATTGDMIFSVCEICGFIFNRAFEHEKLEYGDNYENSQLHSNIFNQHVSDIINNLINIGDIKNSKIMEIGCGNGQFLIKLMKGLDKSNTGYGFDPSYKKKSSILENNIVFSKKYFLSDSIDFISDIVISRHVIEHIPEPIPFLQEIRKNIEKNSRVFTETPRIDWILKNHVFWDFTYEHCSFFSFNSITTAFEISGFKVIIKKAIFGEQYMWIECKKVDQGKISKNGKEIVKLTKEYLKAEKNIIKLWLEKISKLQKNGKIALWGAGGKGTTFANLLDPKNIIFDCIIDINPKKWNKFIPGSGHIIINPKEIEEKKIKSIIIMNPNYTNEVSKMIQNKDIILVNT